jgi:hypothetical protein
VASWLTSAPRNFAHLCHRVDVGDLGGQERVGRGLDQFGGGEVGLHHRSAVSDDGRVAGVEECACLPGGHAEDQPVRVEGVLNSVPFPEELGVPRELGPAARRGVQLQELGQPLRRAYRNRGLAGHKAVPVQVRCQPGEGGVQKAEVGRRRIEHLRGADTQEMDICARRGGEVGAEAQPAAVQHPAEQLVQSRLIEGQRSTGQ